MSTTAELETFVRKFHQLWNDGQSAHLDLDCKDGVAWVGLRLQLGRPPGPLQHQVYPSPHHRKSYSPSYKRRRERRACARANSEHAEEASNLTETVGNAPTEEVVNASDVILSVENAEQASTENEIVVNDENIIESENIEEENVEALNVNDDGIVEITVENEENKNKDNAEEINDTLDISQKIGNRELCEVNNTTVVTSTETPVPDIVPVYAIATIENCPDSKLNEEYGQSIRRFLASEPHLAENITLAELQCITSRSFRNNMYTHTMSVVIYVKTGRLWESAANYVRRHLGLSNYWSRSNGANIRLSRIHQK